LVLIFLLALAGLAFLRLTLPGLALAGLALPGLAFTRLALARLRLTLAVLGLTLPFLWLTFAGLGLRDLLALLGLLRLCGLVERLHCLRQVFDSLALLLTSLAGLALAELLPGLL